MGQRLRKEKDALRVLRIAQTKLQGRLQRPAAATAADAENNGSPSKAARVGLDAIEDDSILLIVPPSPLHNGLHTPPNGSPARSLAHRGGSAISSPNRLMVLENDTLPLLGDGVDLDLAHIPSAGRSPQPAALPAAAAPSPVARARTAALDARLRQVQSEIAVAMAKVEEVSKVSKKRRGNRRRKVEG